MNIPALDIQQQLATLSSRNIHLGKASGDILLQYGYYNLINGYKDALLDPTISRSNGSDFYADGTTLEQFVELYYFDSELRRNILSCMSIIETQMKSLISLHFSLRYGTDHWKYLRPNSFTSNPRQVGHVNSLLYKINKSINKFSTYKPHPSICHFVNKYNQIPLWALNTIMTFGTMTNFYDLLTDDMKKKIAHAVNPRLTPKSLSSILYYLTGIRNKCAHGNRLYTHKLDQRVTHVAMIPQLSVHKSLQIPRVTGGTSYLYGQDDILAALICIAVFFGQTHVYQVNYESIDNSLSVLSKRISPSVEDRVREVTGLKREYIKRLESLSI